MADLRIHPISSLDLPELAPYRTLRRPFEHEEQGIFVAEGDKVVRRMLESHFGVVSVLLPEDRLAEFEPLLRARPERTSGSGTVATRARLSSGASHRSVRVSMKDRTPRPGDPASVISL